MLNREESTHGVYAELLNALDQMQQSPAYAVRWPVLADAEHTIVNLEREESRLRQRVEVLEKELSEARQLATANNLANEAMREGL